MRELCAALVEDGPGARVDVMAAFLAGIGSTLGHGVELGLDATAGANKPCAAELDLHDGL